MDGKGLEVDNTSLSDILRIIFQPILLPVARFLGRLGLTPNMLSIIGMGAYVFAALLLAAGHPYGCALVLGVFGPLDVLDGTLARDSGQESDYGAFLDATLDRYEEFFIYAGLLYYLLEVLGKGAITAVLVLSALSGSFFVSYTRAKAEALGFECSVGILTRFERIVLFIVAIITGWYDAILAVIAALSFVTTFQRMAVVAKQARGHEGK
ncbi:MAG: CDP-alcohol phosphatidyltransferase family protein [Thermodesulfobacteria bacterium]|nr:CDP-alcohol phosphatidyltransferase family protein [Thermodesulfobacteriota bacterium]